MSPERAYIEARIERVTESGCWIWTASTRAADYGAAYFGGRQWRAHRLSWFAYRGALTDGMFVLHSCDVPPCVNPAHLSLGTHCENMLDMQRKGRHGQGHMTGEAHGQARLSGLQVAAIRHDDRKIADIARSYLVNWSTIKKIKVGDTWRAE